MSIESPDDIGLRCPICLNAANNPHITSCCGSVFCGTHANLDLYTNGCPLCRRTNFSFGYSSKHQEWIDRYTIQCQCSEQIFKADHQKHIERCSKPTFLCPHDACKEKGETRMYNTKELTVHLSTTHCTQVSIGGQDYVKTTSAESDIAISKKYVKLSRRLKSIIYPKMIKLQQEDLNGNKEKSSLFQCPRGHKLIHASPVERKLENHTPYMSQGFCCDVCDVSFLRGKSWHCSCFGSGFDMCDLCLVSKLYDFDDQSLADAQAVAAEERVNSRIPPDSIFPTSNERRFTMSIR